MTHRLLALTLFLMMNTGCPETWRKGGSIDRAMAKDMEEEWRDRERPPRCPMPDDEWLEACMGDSNHAASGKCMPECQIKEMP